MTPLRDSLIREILNYFNDRVPPSHAGVLADNILSLPALSVPAAYLRDLDGTGSLHVCAAGDPGAVAVYAIASAEQVSA